MSSSSSPSSSTAVMSPSSSATIVSPSSSATKARAVHHSSTASFDINDITNDLHLFEQDDNIKHALNDGMDLLDYTSRIDDSLKHAEQQSCTQYINAADQVSRVYHHIESCDTVLERMESMLKGFQMHLGTISTEIRSLQHNSLSMNVKLRNRKMVECELSKIIDGMAIGEDLARCICDAALDTNEYIQSLMILNDKITYLSKITLQSTSSAQLSLSARQASEHVATLRDTAISRIRTFLLQSFHALHKPKTNVQIKQSMLLKYRYLAEFLSQHSAPIFNEVCIAYTTSTSRMYHMFMKRYINNMMRLRVRHESSVVERSDVIGARTDNTPIHFFATNKNEQYYMRVFSLRQRDKVLLETNQKPIIVHIARQHGDTFTWHTIFRSCVRLLACTASSEFMFTSQFFPNNASLFKDICAKSIDLFTDTLKQYLLNSHDAISVLIVIRILHKQQALLNQQRITCLDHAFDRMNMILWPKFQMIIHDNLVSITNVVEHVKDKCNEPHVVIRRYAVWCTALSILNTPYNDEIVRGSLQRLRLEIDAFLIRMSLTISSTDKQSIFLIHNYAHIISNLRDSTITSSEDTHAFEELLGKQVLEYVENELKHSNTFRKIIAFVKDINESTHVIDPSVSSSSSSSAHEYSSAVNTEVFRALYKGFRKQWQNGINMLKSNAMEKFAMLDTIDCDMIIKKLLMQWLSYYQRFHDMVKASATSTNNNNTNTNEHSQIVTQLVSMQTMVHEIKKHLR